jgi:tRNA (cytidine/uridine-2'-O-)-methyltransferase
MRLALFEPDIPQNTGAILRLAACLGVAVDVIEPCGFVWSDRHLRRSGMDYLDLARVERHPSWDAFLDARAGGDGRLLLLTTAATASPLWTFRFAPGDTLLLGRESTGVTDAVRAAADVALRIPMRAGARSLNVALAAALAMGEALRQTDLLPGSSP